MNNTILVYGWYYKNNVGDDLFINAFHKIFPDLKFIFTNNISIDLLKDIATIFIGGGSFLNIKPNITDEALKVLINKNIFYIGVGAETDIHPIHLQLMKLAKLIAIRSNDLEKLITINLNSIVIPDIVYSLQDEVKYSKRDNKSVLILPNICVIPSWNSEQWKHAAWAHFKSEFAQFLDHLIDQKYNVNFFSMCQNNVQHDRSAAMEIMNMMIHKQNNYLLADRKCDIKLITSIMSKYSAIITQRYHGHILANMVNVPNFTIYHHNKLKSDFCVPFYETSKDRLIEQFNNINISNILPIDRNIFKSLQDTVMALL